MDVLATPGISAHPLVDAIDLPIGRWDRDVRLTFCNAPYLRWAGRPRSELLGRTLWEIYGQEAWAAAEPAFENAFGGRAGSYERLLSHLASPRWARIQAFPDRDEEGRVCAVCTLAFDIHHDVLQRQAHEAARRRLDHFTGNIPYPLTYVDQGCVLRFVNRAYEQATGTAAETLVGRHIGEVRGPQRWLEHRPYFERALAGETVHYTRLTTLADRGQRWMRTSYVPDCDDDDGHVLGVYTVTVDVHELTLAQERLKRSVEHDALTDALSRRTIMDRIDAAVAGAQTAPAALFFVDLDGLKAVNDGQGHHEGDRVLRAVASALLAAVRAEDAVGRFGGDEFLVLAPVRDRASADTLAHHLLDAVRGAGVAVTASVGYAIAPLDATDAMKLLQRADDAMYAAKRLGKNRVVAAAG